MANSTLSSKIPVQFKIEDILTLDGELRLVLAPRTVERILALTPISSRLHLWKQELYFEAGVKMGAENAKTFCKAGEICYWPQGDAICVFFEDLTPYSKVNPIGTLDPIDFMDAFDKLRSGMMIQLHQTE